MTVAKHCSSEGAVHVTPCISALRLPAAKRRPRGLRVASLLLVFLAAASARAQFTGPTAVMPTDEALQQTELTTDPSILFPPMHNSYLRAGDVLAIKMYGDTEYAPTARIDVDGNIQLPLVGPVHVGGLSVAQAESLIEQKLIGAGMYRDPQIFMTVTDGPDNSIAVMGENHFVVPAIGTRRLYEVLASAGGIAPTTSHIITINRVGLAQPIVVDIGNNPSKSAAANIPLFPGDTVITSRVGNVYVLGAFKTVGLVPMNTYGPLTLTELSALSGGPTPVAKNGDLRIIRTVGNRRTVSTLNIKDVLNGKVPDPLIQPNDIVYLPTSGFKSFFIGGTLSTLLSFTSLAISLESIR
jgi:polysaccharide export outer membrane protein